MEAFALYLLKSVIWLTGFALVFLVFLRNERFFGLNRIFLVTGIISSFLLPFISVHYTVVLPVVRNVQHDETVISGIQNAGYSNAPVAGLLFLIIYLTGVLLVLSMIIKQSSSVLKVIKKAEIISSFPVRLIRTTKYPSSFSFFSYVFVNPSITDLETNEIVNHELVHIRQRHWFDLVLVELLCMVQWFNPLVWIYIRFIRQNHEYLADEVALQRTSDPAIYRAALLNQIVGSQIVSLANFFNYSLNKKRFNMMKNIINSPWRKMKIFLILPVFAIVLYAFAKPDYRYNYLDETSGNKLVSDSVNQHEVKGKVIADGYALPGASIVIQNTTQGTSTDANGFFKFDNVPEDRHLVVSFVGYKSKVIKPVFTSEMTVIMIKDTVKYLNLDISTPPPPPPPPPPPSHKDVIDINAPPPPPPTPSDSVESINTDTMTPPPASHQAAENEKNLISLNPEGSVKIRSADGKSPLIMVDGIITNIDVTSIDPETIESISVYKDNTAIDLYGEKGKDGVISITTKKNDSSKNEKTGSDVKSTGSVVNQDTDKDTFVVVEELPEFPGGKDAMAAWIISNLKYPAEAVKSKITGKVFVDFMVSSSGKVKNVQVTKPVNPLLVVEAKRVISSMPDWKPGTQHGKPVPVQMMVPVEFKLQ
jgi:TonB family protein